MKLLKKFFTPTIFLIIAIICCILELTIGNFTVKFATSILGGAAIMFLYPLVSVIFKTKLPKSLEYVFYVHVFLAMYLGTAYDVYNKISWFDLLLHGAFGIEGCFFAYLLLVKNKCARKVNFFIFLVFLLVFSMGCGAIWEIYEFTYDCLTGEDSQHVKDALLAGLNPVADTMGDIIITLVGVMVTYVGIFIDRHFGFKCMKAIYLDFGGTLEDSVAEHSEAK